MLDKEKRILVVDDIQPARETVLNILRVLGYNKWVEAVNGEEALQALEDNPDVGLIISDWKMPRMDGGDFLRRVRSDSRWEELPFLFLTSKSEYEDVAEASDLGVTEYMVKPLSIDVLAEKMKGLDADTPMRQLSRIVKEVDELCSRSDFKAAAEKLEPLLTEIPSLESRVRFELARVYYRSENLEKSRQMVEKALELNPLMSRAWQHKARLDRSEGKWSDVRASLGKALEIAPRNIRCLLDLGDALLNSEDYIRAREIFQRAINVAPRENWIKQEVWNLYLEQNLLNEVERDFGPTILDYLDSDTLNNYAVALRKNGELEKSTRLYVTAVKKDPHNSKLLFNAAVADFYQGETERARKRLEKALEEDPGFEQANKFLKKLNKDAGSA